MLIVRRSPQNPLITPVRERAWESLATFNPSPVIQGNATHLYYRAVSRPDVLISPYAGVSTIGYATADVGSDRFSSRKQVIVPEQPWEMFGCEDPRATFFEGKWYVFYTALGGFPFSAENIKVAVAVGDSPDALSEKHLVTPFNAKAATLFPERINGEVVLILTAHTDYTDTHPRPTIAIARAKNIEDFWSQKFWDAWHEKLSEHALPDVRRNDSEHVEVGAAPIKTNEGWLLVYSHIQNYYDEAKRIFGIEALLLSPEDPTKVVGSTAYPFLVPEETYERYGLIPNIVFPSGAALRGDTLDVYFGGADTVCAVASLSLSDLLETMQESKRNNFLKRFAGNPILRPIPGHTWESRLVFNAAAVDLDGSVHLLYRAMGNENTSVMGYARLSDGLHVDERLAEPVYVPRASFEQKGGSPTGNSGCEDPRLTQTGDTVYLCYTAYDGVHETRGTLSTISVKDFVAHNFTWSEPKLLTPSGINDKDVCLFPEAINRKALVMHRIDPNICIDQFDSFVFDRTINKCIEIMTPRQGMWDDQKIGAAGAPHKVPGGWLLIYHGVSNDKVYRLGAALLDETGTNVISRMVAPILEPVLDWEKTGEVNNVVFSCGTIIRDDNLFVYYGGADTFIGVATVSVATLLKKLQPSL